MIDLRLSQYIELRVAEHGDIYAAIKLQRYDELALRQRRSAIPPNLHWGHAVQ